MSKQLESTAATALRALLETSFWLRDTSRDSEALEIEAMARRLRDIAFPKENDQEINVTEIT